MGQHIYITADWTDAQKVLDWVQTFAPREKMRLYQDLLTRLRLMAPIVSYGLLAIVVLMIGATLVRKFPFLMVIGACLVQWLGCSGITYNLIHGMNWTGGQGEYIAKSNRQQFVGVGLACSGLFLSCGLCMLTVYGLANRSYTSKLKSGIASVVSLVAVAGSFASMWVLMSVYQGFKAGWYQPPDFFPPGDYLRGPINKDRGLSFVNTEAKAFYESSHLVMYFFSTYSSVYTFTYKTFRTYLKRLKKACQSNWMITKAYKTWLTVFDVVYTPLEYLFGRLGESKKSRSSTKRSSSSKKKRER